jgi:hypothetical protein
MWLRTSTWLVIGVFLLDVFVPPVVYDLLYDASHGRRAPVYFDPDCWQVTAQFVFWLMGCLGLAAIATVGVGLLAPKGGWLLRLASCRGCGYGLLPEDLYCPACAGPTAAWDMPTAMRTAHARASAEHVAALVGIPPEVIQAARFVVEQTRPVTPDAAAALAILCLADAVLLRRLYFAAALRLHPDRNAGQLQAEWQRLQQSVRTLRAYQGQGL